jgi:hypothetical protein
VQEGVKKPTLKSLKNKCWKLFSEYIRRRNADEGGTTRCVTCGTAVYWKECDAGHFIGGRTNAVLFHEEIVHPQCKVCNIWKRGNYQAYTLYMLDKYGREKVDEFLQLKHQVRKYTTSELEEMIGKYKQKLSELS